MAGARAAAGDTAVYDCAGSGSRRGARKRISRSRGERVADCALLGILAGVSEPKVEIAGLTLLQVGGSPSAGRADLAARERRLLAAAQRVRAARAARLPEIAVGAGLKQVSDPTGAAYGPVVSLGVTVPIFNAEGTAIAAARARERALDAELVIARRSVQAQQASAAGRGQAAREAAVKAAGARGDAARLGTIAETAYRAGEIGVVELLDAHEAGRDAELKVIELALAAAEAAIAFDLAQGGEVP